VKKRLIAIVILVAVGGLLLFPLVHLLSRGSGTLPTSEVVSMSIDTSKAEQKRLLAVFETHKVPIKLTIDAARIAHFYVRPEEVREVRAALVQEQQKGLKVTINDGGVP
jgi:hypothetical protein